MPWPAAAQTSPVAATPAVAATLAPPAETTTRAAALFDAGVADLKLGKFETACAALEQSHALDPKIGALLALADCFERWGKVHSAAVRYEALVAELSNASDGAYRAPQLAYAREALARLAPKVPKLRLVAAAPNHPDRTLLDGQPLTLAAGEQEVSVDPGRHVIETEAAGHEPWRLELDVDAGEQRNVPIELGSASLLKAVPPAAADAATLRAAPDPERREAPPLDAPEATSSAWRTLGWGLGGLGVAGVGVGAVAGILVLRECPSFDCDSSQSGEDLALVADIGFGVGLAALAASAIVLLSTEAAAPPASAHWRPTGSFDARGGWLGMSHEF